jgi:predicted nucleotidyltransferase
MNTASLASDKILEQIVNSIVQLVNPDKIILFGSRATGKATKDSDYDVCVLKKNANRKKMLDKIYRTGIDVFAPLDVVVNTPKRFDELKHKSYMVYYDVAKEGRVIYEKRR